MKSWMVVVAALGGFAGCAHGTPQELLDARRAQQRLSVGEVETATPEDAYMAKRALQTAERAFRDEGDCEHTRALAYVALRRAQRAEVLYRVRTDEARLAALEARTPGAASGEERPALTAASYRPGKISSAALASSASEPRTVRLP